MSCLYCFITILVPFNLFLPATLPLVTAYVALPQLHNGKGLELVLPLSLGAGTTPQNSLFLPTPTYLDPGATIVSQQSTPVQPAPPPFQLFYNARIGAWLAYTPLSDKQRQIWGINNQVAFMVHSLDPDGVAENGFMMIGDMLIEIDRKLMLSQQLLINTLDTSPAGTSLSVRVLRGGQALDLDLDV